jgi:hypothetical protein
VRLESGVEKKIRQFLELKTQQRQRSLRPDESKQLSLLEPFVEAIPPSIEDPEERAHYRPKGRKEFARLAFRWDNWLLSCGKCNESKWQHFPDCEGQPCLLDPTVDEPSEHLTFSSARVVGLTSRGRVTAELLGLDRGPLEDQREAWLQQIGLLMLLLLRTADEHDRKQVRDFLIWSLQDSAPYCAMTRAYIAEYAPALVESARASGPVPLPDARRRLAAMLRNKAEALRDLLYPAGA